MRFRAKTHVQTEEFDKKVAAYNKAMDEYERNLDKYADDDALLQIHAGDEPEPPKIELQDSYVFIKDEYITGYEMLQNMDLYKDEPIIKVFVDKTKCDYPYIISFYDDKIMAKLEELIK